jgi:HTH-type transcriptional regulator / antitoxin MqsA
MAPKTHTCGDCGGQAREFGPEDFTVEHRGGTAVVQDLSGWRCGSCNEVEFDDDSAVRYAAAGDALVTAARKQLAREIRDLRRKLNLTQVQAAQLTGGGANAFSRYERGEAQPMPAVVNLLRILSRHPELLKELPVRELEE